MKKLFLSLMLCSLVAVAGCNQKTNEPQVPKSVKIYQELNLTAEQNQKLSVVRADQRKKIDAIRKDIEQKRESLLNTKGLTDAQKTANLEQYKKAATEMRTKLAAERTAYDNALMNILDDNQKATYQKYLKQREKEKIQREKEFLKQAK